MAYSIYCKIMPRIKKLKHQWSYLTAEKKQPYSHKGDSHIYEKANV
jgi:hypothetical protein